MILCIDIGGTKTSVASLTPRGRLLSELRFPTPRTESEFLATLTHTINKSFPIRRITAISIAIPGPVKPGQKKPLYLDNLPWHDLDIVTPIKKLFKVPVSLGNDAQLAALWETRLTRSRAVYITLSTGIGVAVTTRGRLDPDFITYEPGHDLYGDTEWEDLASARAISTLFGQPVTEITDAATLTTVAERISIGLIPVIEAARPKLIVFDGPLGRALPHYRAHLIPLLPKRMQNIKLRPARTRHAVIYGCYLNATRRR